MNQYFDNMAWIDSIDIFSGLQVSEKIQVDNVHTQNKIQAFTNVAVCPTNKEGKVTAQPKVFKCKLDSGAGANLMSLKTYREGKLLRVMVKAIVSLVLTMIRPY